MKNSLKMALFVVGIALVGYGLYTVFVPDTIIEAGPIQVKGTDNKLETQSIVLIGLGVLALLTPLFYKKK